MVALDDIAENRRRAAETADRERLERLIKDVHEIVLRRGPDKEKLLLIQQVLAVNGYF